MTSKAETTEQEKSTDLAGRLDVLVSIPDYVLAYKNELERATGRNVDIEQRGSWWYIYVHKWGDWMRRKNEILVDTENLKKWGDGELWSQFK